MSASLITLTTPSAGKRLDQTGLQAAASLLAVTPTHIQAVLDVETAGSGYDSQGRVKILFEPHVFYQLLAGPSSADKLHRAVTQHLAYPTWGERPYPLDSYPTLQRAAGIDTDKALMACSWGLGQLMGYHHSDVGYATVVDMALAARASEDNQLMMMVRFIGSIDGLAAALRQNDWETFARSYNGARAVESYAYRLSRAWRNRNKSMEV